MEANCLDLKHGGARLRQRIQAAVHSVGVAYQGGFLEEGLDRSLNPRWHEWKGEPLHHLSLQTLTRMTQAGHQVLPLGRLPWAGKADSPALPCSPRGYLWPLALSQVSCFGGHNVWLPRLGATAEA